MHVRPHELKPGVLGRLFREGAKAAVLVEDQRIEELWSSLVASNNPSVASSYRDECPWETSILDVARNHQAANPRLGDMLRFIPGDVGYIARKFLVRPSANGGGFQSSPERFWNNGRRVAVPQSVLKTAWTVMSDVLTSTLPENFHPPEHAVVVERLKYPNSVTEFEAMATLLRNSGGRWAQLAYKLDSSKPAAAGPFDRRILRDLFAASCLVPGLGPAVRRLNEWIQESDRDQPPPNTHVIGRPHLDHNKLITALAGDRDALRTEVHAGNGWVEIPLDARSLTIFPSKQIDRSLGISPTRHRVLMVNGPQPAQSRPNVTLVLAVANPFADEASAAGEWSDS